MSKLISIIIWFILIFNCFTDAHGLYCSNPYVSKGLELFDKGGGINNTFPFITCCENLTHQKAGNYELINHTQNFVLTISLNKTFYLEGEPLWLTFNIKNIGTRDSLPLLHDETLAKSLIIVDQKGNKKAYLGEYSSYLGKSYRVFEPSETAAYVIELEEFFGDQTEGLKAFSPEGCLKEGKYTVESNYKDGKVLLLKSNKLTFEINKPIGKELEALNAVRTIYQMPEKNETEILCKSHALREFYSDYNESVYAGISFFYMSLLIDMSKGIGLEEPLINEVGDFINKYPDFPFIIDIIKLGQNAVYKFKNGNDAVIEYLTEIMQKHPGTIAFHKAEMLLKDINR